MELARKRLDQIILHCQQAIKLLELDEKRRAIGVIDEIEDNSEAAKWLLINQVIEEEGEF